MQHSGQRGKLLRQRKQFGRCRVEGHGDNCFCEVCEDIQSTPFTRAQDKREAEGEILEQIIFSALPNK